MDSAQTAFWNHYTIYDTRYDRPKRSEKRQRTERVTIRLLPSERDALVTAAELAGISVAELLRATTLQYVTAFEHSLTASRKESGK